MQERLSIEADPREVRGKGAARKIRFKGLVPAILYGQGSQAQPLTVNLKAFKTAFVKAGGTSALFELSISGKAKIPVMVKDYQADVLSRDFLHVDFLKIDLTKKIEVEVPIHLTGKPAGLKEGGIVEHTTRTITIICLPTAIPEFVEADISALNIGDNIHVHDLKLPEGVELAPGSDETIASVILPAEEKAPEVAVAAEAAVVEGAAAGAAPAAAGAAKPGEAAGSKAAGKDAKDKPKEEKKDKK